MLFAGAGERAARTNSLVVVIDGHRKCLLGLILTNHVFVKKALDFARLRKVNLFNLLRGLAELLFNDFVAKQDALVTDKDTWAGDELANLLLALSAERTLEQVARFAQFGHD